MKNSHSDKILQDRRKGMSLSLSDWILCPTKILGSLGQLPTLTKYFDTGARECLSTNDWILSILKQYLTKILQSLAHADEIPAVSEFCLVVPAENTWKLFTLIKILCHSHKTMSFCQLLNARYLSKILLKLSAVLCNCSTTDFCLIECAVFVENTLMLSAVLRKFCLAKIV